MVSASLVRTTTALVAAAGLASAALPQIERHGQYLWNSQTGERFYVKGVGYAANYGTAEQKPADDLTARDVLLNVAGCQRDVPSLKALGVNVVRVYQIADGDHSACMKLLDEAGIYVLADLATHLDAISGQAPKWDLELMQHYLGTIVDMGQYSNTLGFLVGNEVLNGPSDTQAAVFLKAATRDVKTWMNDHGYKNIVGYAATDKPESRINLAQLFACGDAAGGVDETNIADFYGINAYSFCGASTYEQSGYATRTEELRNIGIPVMFTENGCGPRGTRKFDDTPIILGPAMDYVFTGTFAFEFHNEDNQFGLVTLSPDGKTITPTADYTAYQSQIAASKPTPMLLESYTSNVTLPLATCPTPDATNFPAATKLPPTPNSDLCACAVAASGCVASSTVEDAKLGEAFGAVCGQDEENCRQISADGTFTSGGVYGKYSMCAPQQQLSIILGSYYEKNGRTAEACNFGGIAQVQAASGTVAQCEATKSFPNGVGVPTPSAAIDGAKPPSGNAPSPGGNNNNTTNPPKGAAGSLVPSLAIALGALVFGVVSLVA